MTTVVVTPTEVAHDTRGSNGGAIMSNEIGKSIVYQGDVYIGLGSASAFVYLMHVLIKGKPHPRWSYRDQGFVICSRHNGEVEILYLNKDKDGKVQLNCDPILIQPYAYGSGGNWALAKLDQGANAKEAIEYAMSRDTATGGTITVLPRQRTEPLPDFNLEWLNGGTLKIRTLVEEVITERGEDYSMESLGSGELPLKGNLFVLPDLAKAKEPQLNRIVKWTSGLTDRNGVIANVFQDLRERWAYGVEGKVKGLGRAGKVKPYTDMLGVSFHKPAGLQTLLLPYLDTLAKCVELCGGLDQQILDTQKYVRKCLGDIDAIQHYSSELGNTEALTGIHTSIAKHIDPNMTNNRTTLDALVGRNADWVKVESEFHKVAGAYNKLPIKQLPNLAISLSKDVSDLALAIQGAGEVKSILAGDNYKALLSDLENLAYAIDACGALGYALQQLETALIQNINLFEKLR